MFYTISISLIIHYHLNIQKKRVFDDENDERKAKKEDN